MRHALGVLGVLAAGVLLAVSAAMNWRFGFQLGTTEFDGLIYGSASAAADCLKALVPFFIFAAIKNRMWSQAAASAVVWLVVTAYSLTSALGHAALNRQDTAGQRAAQTATYTNLQADLKRAQEQLSWVPQHRPAGVVQSELSSMEARKPWKWSRGCTKILGKITRKFCGEVTALKAELASAEQAAKLEQRVAKTQDRLAQLNGAGPRAADPQAQILAKLTGVFMPGVSVEDVQTALAVFIALLLEVGSGLGMYIAFSQWRMGDKLQPRAVEPRMTVMVDEATEPVQADERLAIAASAPPVDSANDNRDNDVETRKPSQETVARQPEPGFEHESEAETQPDVSAPVTARLVVPESDVERFRRERTYQEDGSSLTATELYEDYCAWCEDQEKEPLALPTFGREFADLGIQKAKISGRVRYIGVALRTAGKGDKNAPACESKAA